jgi:hypothetical protein
MEFVVVEVVDLFVGLVRPGRLCFLTFSLCQYFIQICEFCTFFFFIASFTLTKNSISASGSLNSRSQISEGSQGPWSSSDAVEVLWVSGVSWIIIGIVRMRFGQLLVMITRGLTVHVFGLWKSWKPDRTVFHPATRTLSAREM